MKQRAAIIKKFLLAFSLSTLPLKAKYYAECKHTVAVYHSIETLSVQRIRESPWHRLHINRPDYALLRYSTQQVTPIGRPVLDTLFLTTRNWLLLWCRLRKHVDSEDSKQPAAALSGANQASTVQFGANLI